MKTKNIFKIAITLVFAFSSSLMSAQIYNADFSNNGDGFANHSTGSPPAAAPASLGPFGSSVNKWSLSYTSIPSTDSSENIFKVSGGSLISNDWGGQGIFQSQSIDVSGINTVNIAAASVNSGANDNSFEYFYILDGSTRVGTGNITSSDGVAVNYTVNGLDVSGASTLVVGFKFSENGGDQGYNTSSFTVTNTAGAATPGITLGAVSGNTNENGTKATFTVILNTQPTTNVVLNVSSGDSGEVIVSPAVLTFTSANWDTSQIVTSTGVDDALIDGNVDVTITLSINDAASDDTYDAVTDVTTTFTNEDDDIINIIINEILADPGSIIDANGDGIISTYDDEFVELVNLNTSSHDLTGYTISDLTGIKHTFGATTIPAGGSVVIFGGGTPTGIPGITDTATGLSLNNIGDTITLKNSEGTVITTYTYGNEGNDDQSIGRNDDLTGGFVKHAEILSNPIAASPGRYNSSGQPFSINTWTGATDNSWATASNWSLGIVPGTGDDIQILKATNQPTASSAVTVNSVLINSGASLIAEATFLGTATYKRNLSMADSWYFVSSPVDGETIQNLISSHTFLSSTSVAGRIGIAPYANTQALSTKRWAYQTTSSTGDLEDAKGYSVQLDEVGNISFSGTIRTDDLNADIPLILGGVSGNNFNLVGNPYTSYINSSTFLTTQSIDLEPDFYMWNGSSYDTRSTGSHADFMIAPGQGFFVEAKTANTVTFIKSNQNHNATNTFQKSNSRPEIKLLITDNVSSRYADIYYINGTTKGFDNGYDGKLFGGVPQPFAIYTHLVSDSEGKNFQIQSLPNSEYENMIIPIGINSALDKELTFSAETLNLPKDLNVFLEDRQLHTFTSLDQANSTYKITLSEALNGIGRFYLHTTSKSILSTNKLDLDNISIYKTNNHNLRIVGLSEGKTTIKLFNILGKQLLNSLCTSNGVQDISLPKVAAGIYIVQLETETGKLNKKITLE